MKMKKNLLKMALLAFATFAASVASAQSTYVLYGNVGEGEVKLSTTREQANAGPMTVSDYSENGQVVGFTQTITETGSWFLSYDWFGSEIDPVILKGTEYNLVYDVRTSWSGDVKLKFEVQTKGAIEKPVSFDHDGKWHTITIPVQSWVDANVLQTIESSSRVMFGFVGGNWNVKEPTTIDYRNVKLVPVNVVPDNEAPTWVSEPTVVASPTAATISVNAKDNISTILKYEVSKTEDFATPEASVSGKANEATEIALKGLSQKTGYKYYVRVKDMAGNVGDVKTVTFTTTEAPALEEVTYYGIAGGSDKANWINTVDGYFPTIEYSATTTAYNQMVFKIKLSEIGKGFATPELWCDQLPAPGFVGMTKVEGTTNEFTATLFDENAKARGDQINFRFRFPMEGGAPMTQNIYMKVGDSNAKPSEDTTVPTWGSDPVAQNVTDKTAEIVVNVKDDSGSAFITLTGDNGFAEVKKTVKADGTDQTIALNGLTANTKYNLTLAIADAAGNAGESKTVNFTTLEAPDLEPLYLTINFTSEDWNKAGETNTFAPNGNILLTVNADNTVTFKVTMDQDRTDFGETLMYFHPFPETDMGKGMTRTAEGVYEYTTTGSITDRDVPVEFHMYFTLPGGCSSTFKNKTFTPSEGSTSAVAEVEAEAAKVVAANGVIRVEGDKTFAVYTVAGQLAFRGMGEVRLDKGVYVVVVDGKAQKVML